VSGRPPDPAPLMQLSTAYWASQTLLTANRMGVFERLAKGAQSSAQLAQALGTQERATTLFLNACVALGLLEAGPGGYANSALAAAFLVPGRPGYLGNAMRYSDNLYTTWGALESSLRNGAPALAPESYLGQDPRRTRDFVYGMHDRALGIGQALVALVDLGERRRLLDIGGGPGTYAALFARRYPQLRAIVIDLPEVVALAGEIIADMGATGAVSTRAGSYLDCELPPGQDVVLISGVFHRESATTCRDLIARALAALEPGGLLLVSDVFADAGGTSPPFATLFGLNMLLTARDGGVHSDADVAAWMEQAGCARTERRAFPPPMPHRVVMGYKS
jgi:3-hydroxy-5-methyl-1-naphthoate 3-O-methyltransferase